MIFLNKIKKLLHLSWLFSARVLTEKKRWHTIDRNERKVPRVFYGHEQIPKRNEYSGGAIIKFQDLNDWFPNTVRNANILYLVNSALPIFTEIIVRKAKKCGVVFVLNQNGVAYPAWHGPGWEKTNRPMQSLLQQADYVIYQSEFCKLGADKFLGPCRVPWKVLYNPVDIKRFVPNAVVPPGEKLLLAGSHQHFYRVRTALDALKRILVNQPGVTLTIAGRYAWLKSESECLAEVQSYARELGVLNSVDLRGGYSQSEAPLLFQTHHILLHTKYNDPCPRLVVEGMACGLPVVYSKSGGVPELVGDEAGIGIPTILDWEQDHPPDPSEIAKATIKIISHLDYYAKSARKRAESCFDVTPWREKHAAIFNELLQKKVN